MKTLLLFFVLFSLASLSSYAHGGGSLPAVAKFYQEVLQQCIKKAEYSENQSCSATTSELCFYRLDLSQSVVIIEHEGSIYRYECSKNFPYVRSLFYPSGQEQSAAKFKEYIKRVRVKHLSEQVEFFTGPSF